MTWCVVKAKPIPLWKNCFRICTDPIVYIIALLEGILVVGTAYVLQQFEPIKWDWNELTIYTSVVAAGFPIPLTLKSVPGRNFFMFQLFAATIFVSILSSVLIIQITTPMLNPQINSIQEIIAGDFNLVGD